MLRKHGKVEPARLYYWCDKLGILVWQDMPGGDNKKIFRGEPRNPPHSLRRNGSVSSMRSTITRVS